MAARGVVLSKRLQMLADMVEVGDRVADVGCDHGFLSIYLVQKGISPRVIAMDVRKGPLGAAKEHITSGGLEAYIDTRLSDGVKQLEKGEADTVVCAGMGGALIQRILREGMEKVRNMTLILQPQSELKEFRSFLRRENFRILEENAVYEDGKYYFAIKAVVSEYIDSQQNRGRYQQENECLNQDCDIFDEYGEKLLEQRHPILKQYLEFRRNVVEQLVINLTEHVGGRGSDETNACRMEERLRQVKDELKGIDEALKWYR